MKTLRSTSEHVPSDASNKTEWPYSKYSLVPNSALYHIVVIYYYYLDEDIFMFTSYKLIV